MQIWSSKRMLKKCSVYKSWLKAIHLNCRKTLTTGLRMPVLYYRLFKCLVCQELEEHFPTYYDDHIRVLCEQLIFDVEESLAQRNNVKYMLATWEVSSNIVKGDGISPAAQAWTGHRGHQEFSWRPGLLNDPRRCR